ncbi:proto-oncogene c-Fos [Etheostoma spectabile]|uniref:proto-oncogene c-Fos n=1 Tax=Etheostoma spectabile TaxID=54343 RepID=UPI0013AECD38|nr:proto-oncogene c-Fos-like [Etheostoma spectabile]
MHPDSSTEFDSSSSCSTASPGGDTPGCSQHPTDSLSSSVDSAKDTEISAAGSFVPTVTAISTSPDLRWMVQPTVITSVPPSSRRAKTKTHDSTQSSSAASKAKPSNRKGQKEKASKEEEERRRIRRERNKIAAAKCRNRRRELIDTLQAETDKLEDEKSTLQTEIADLLKEKERLEQVLVSHKPSCKLPVNDNDGDDNDDEEDNKEDDDDDAMLQDPPASPQLLSMLENGKPPEGNTTIGEASIGQDMDTVPCIPAAAILGNSNILLCSSAEEEALKDLKGDDLDDLVPSLETAVSPEMAASVPDIDLSSPFCLSDWETLYKSVANDLESLSTPVMSSSPTCSNYRTVFSFNYSEIDSLDEGFESLKGSLGASELMKDSLNSPTLLVL